MLKRNNARYTISYFSIDGWYFVTRSYKTLAAARKHAERLISQIWISAVEVLIGRATAWSLK